MKDKVYSVYRVDHRGEGNPYNRVSETTYQNEQDAQEEVAYWQDILKRYPDGTKIAVR
jgi:hypothetical protein